MTSNKPHFSRRFLQVAALLPVMITSDAEAIEGIAHECCPSKCAPAQSVQFEAKGVWVRTVQGRAFFPFSHKAKFHSSRDDKVWACMMDDEDTEDRPYTIPLCIFLPGTT